MDYGLLGKGTSDPYVKINLLVANGLNGSVSKVRVKYLCLHPSALTLVPQPWCPT